MAAFLFMSSEIKSGQSQGLHGAIIGGRNTKDGGEYWDSVETLKCVHKVNNNHGVYCVAV
jgi:hypothetical protein